MSEECMSDQAAPSAVSSTGRQLRQRQPKKYDASGESQEAPSSGRSKKSREFIPEASQRETKKLNRRLQDSQKKSSLYDSTGRLVADSRDACDCVEPNCPGCHMPCPKCDSEKCGQECRVNRRWIYYEVEIEGGEQKFTFK